jgi:TRAP-type C4-dicarboxylate transport system permease small subunit
LEKFDNLITKSCRLMDKVAGLCVAGTVFLVVINVLMRAIFNRPFLGTYEYVGFSTALIVGLSLAYCAIMESHITVDLLTNQLPNGVRDVVVSLAEIISFGFVALVTWQLVKYAGNIQSTGEVSPTTEVPLYPFIYLVALGFFALSLVALGKTVKYIRKVVEI